DNRFQHRWMCHLQLLGYGFQHIVNPPGKERRFHGPYPRPWPRLRPQDQDLASRRNCPLVQNRSILRFRTEADRLLVNIESDIVDSIHTVLLIWSLSQRQLASAAFSPNDREDLTAGVLITYTFKQSLSPQFSA